MDNQGMFLPNNLNYQYWKEKMKARIISLRSNVWHLVCNGYTKTTPSKQELQKNVQTLNAIYCSLHD